MRDGEPSERLYGTVERAARTCGFSRGERVIPRWLGLEFGLVLCGPPFFKVSLSHVFAAIRLPARHDFR